MWISSIFQHGKSACLLALLVVQSFTAGFLFVQSAARKAAGAKKSVKKRAARATSNVFAMFDQAQIQEFKEVSSCCF